MAQSTFVERSLSEINRTLEQSLFAEKAARQKGLLQLFDARAKAIATLLLLIAAGSAKRLEWLAFLFALTLLGVVLSRLHLGNFLKRVCLVVLLFTSLIALPALFLTPGAPLWTLPGGLIITRSGATSAAFLLLRVTTSISLASLLVLTTPWNDILRALGMLHLPDVIVLILAMTYRYIHLLLHEAQDMFTSRQSRLLRRLTRTEERELLGNTGGVLLSKSLQLSGEVYLAMQSRGYHHYPRTLNEFHFHWHDGLLLVFSLLILNAVLVFA